MLQSGSKGFELVSPRRREEVEGEGHCDTVDPPKNCYRVEKKQKRKKKRRVVFHLRPLQAEHLSVPPSSSLVNVGGCCWGTQLLTDPPTQLLKHKENI